MMVILLLNVWYNDKRMIAAMQVMSGYIEQKREFHAYQVTYQTVLN